MRRKFSEGNKKKFPTEELWSLNTFADEITCLLIKSNWDFNSRKDRSIAFDI